MLKILIVGFLLLAWFGGVRCYAILTGESLLSEYISCTGLIYIAFGGAIWALAGLASAVSLWMGFSFSARLARLTSLTCLAWNWFDYLFLSRSPLSKTNWIFALAASLLALALAWWVPVLPKEKRFLNRKL